MERISVERRGAFCVFCKLGTVDEMNLGKLLSKDNVTCHYYCLLFASNLAQNGKDEDDSDGIMGFLVEDVQKEVRRVVSTKKNKKFYKCKFCGKEGATIGCWVKKCRAIFHFPCGLKNGVNYKFSSNFDVYCDKHREEPPLNQVPEDAICHICLSTCKKDKMSEEESNTKGAGYITGTCCRIKYYHKACVQKYALNAGSYTFKCPCCNSVDFRAQVENQGVYVPKQDASWEQEPDAFAELSVMGRCEMSSCLCDHGREFYDTSDEESDWKLISCSHCGSTCTHSKCSSLAAQNIDVDDWTCETCRNMKLRKRQATLIFTDCSQGSSKMSKCL